MRRRKLLGAIGLAPPAMLAAQTPASPPAPRDEREPKAFFFDDGRHASALYQFAPPLTAADIALHVDQLVSTGIDTLFYSAGPEGGVVQYDSRVAAKWGDNVDVWTHEIFYRAARNLRQLIADGIDPMRVLCDRAREKRILFLPSVCVCIQGGDRAEDGGLGRKSNFAYDHPQFQVGPDPDPRAAKPARFFGPNRFSFLHAEVRRERLAICEELLARYPTGGIELDLSIDNGFGPFCKFAEADRLAPVLTGWIAEVRTAAGKAARDQQRRKRLYARIPAAGPAYWRSIGFDPAAWVSRKLVDGFICISPHRDTVDSDMDLGPILSVTRGTGCRVLSGFDGALNGQLHASPTREMIWAAAANAYDRGADGFGLAEGMWAPHGWPWTGEDCETLRPLAHPDLLATADKYYRALLKPRPLESGQTVTVPLRIAEDLSRWQALGRAASVRLRVRFANLEPSLNEVRVGWNGRALPDSLLRPIDLHFRVLERGPLHPYGYFFEYALPPDLFPKHGDNQVSVTLVRRDPKIRVPFEIHAIDCAITGRPHRHFEPDPIDY